jgi:RimJ/RimL family protein N-acetyltransferase
MTYRNYPFESDRLRFRKLTSEDLENLYSLDSDPDVVRFVDTRLPKTRDEVQEVLNRIILRYEEWGKYGLWAAELKATDEFVGWFALKPLPSFSNIELGYRLMKRSWGQGFATEGGARLLKMGFDEFKLEEIAAITDPANSASQHVLGKLGFLHEGKRNYQSPMLAGVSEVEFFMLTRERWMNNGKLH